MKRHFTLACLPLLTACAGEPPENIGNLGGRLADCPDSPNCVCSFEERESHYVEPLNASLAEIQRVLMSLPRARIIASDGNYLYAEFTSRIMGFVDDVEFLYDADAGITHVRSASRVGYSDMGVNRERVEAIRDGLDR